MPLLAKTRLTTPMKVLDLDEFEQSVQTMSTAHREYGIAWRPMLSSPPDPAQFGILRGARIAAISLTSLPSLDFAALKGFDLQLLRPPITLGGACLLAEALEHTTTTVACDHFAQVEPLARAAGKIGREIVIDLRLSDRRDNWGVLPGPDLENLARGIARLRGARLRGLLLPAGDFQIARMATAGAASLHKAGHSPEILLVDSLENGRRLSAELPDISCASMTPLPDARLVLAGVIARPSRDVAILDVGSTELGSVPSLISSRLWHVEAIQADVTSLRCEAGGDDMAIGDVLLLRPSSDAHLSHDSPRLLKHHGIWNIAAHR